MLSLKPNKTQAHPGQAQRGAVSTAVWLEMPWAGDRLEEAQCSWSFGSSEESPLRFSEERGGMQGAGYTLVVYSGYYFIKCTRARARVRVCV